MLVPYKNFNYLLLLIVFLFGITANGQIKGTITEAHTGHTIPFATIQLNDSLNTVIMSDIDGQFVLPNLSNTSTVTFQAYKYRSYTLSTDSLLRLDSLQQLITIPLTQNLVFEISDCTSPASMELIRQVIDNRTKNNPQNLTHLSYSTYNKSTFTPKHVENTNKLLEKISNFFSLQFTSFHSDQHFLLLESYTERKVYNKYHHKEIIKGAKSTILDVPSLFIRTKQFHSFTPYDDYINLSGKPYISPISSFIFHKYVYNIIDTISTHTDTIYVIKYHPSEKELFDGLYGLLYINTKNYAVQYFTAAPFLTKKATFIETSQSFLYHEDEKIWFPERIKTKIIANKSGDIYTATLDTYISDVQLNQFVQKDDFDEIVLQYPAYANHKDEEFWKLHRKTPLTTKDSNTYLYYTTADQKKYIQRTLTLGENLYYGVYTTGSIDIDLNRVFDGNQLEGVRIGLGAHTNNKFSEQLKMGAYFGYGFRDQESKGGVDISYKLRNAPVVFQTIANHDIQEAGGVFFPFNTYQYSSESLRRVGIRMFDYVTKWENSVLVHPIKFLDLKGAVSIIHHVTSYAYVFRNTYNSIFNFTEVELGARYAYGEQFIQLLDRKISISTPFPVFYFHFTKGLNNFLGGDFDYSRYEAKIDYKIKIPNIGITGIELIGGFVTGNAPYAKLFNGNGSFRKFSVVVHNSFETMQYNEFLNDRYISLFMSHNFGRIYLRTKFLTPSVLIVQNIGYGGLKHPEYHQFVEFKTMEKGYFESGVLLDNLFLIGFKGLKVGIGPGIFYRYGYYSEAGFFNNFAIKLSTKFKI